MHKVSTKALYVIKYKHHDLWPSSAMLAQAPTTKELNRIKRWVSADLSQLEVVRFDIAEGETMSATEYLDKVAGK